MVWVPVVTNHLIFELFDVSFPSADVGLDFRRRGVSVLVWAVNHTVGTEPASGSLGARVDYQHVT